MKIAFIDHHNGFSGGQKSLLVFLTYLKNKNVDFILIIDKRKSLFYEKLLANGFKRNIRLLKLNTVSSEIDNFSHIHKRPLELLRNINLVLSIFEIRTLLRKECVDIVYANTFKAGLYSFCLNMLFNFKYVFRVRTSLEYSNHGMLDNLIFSKAKKLFSNSKYIESTIPSKYHDKTVTIYNNTQVDNSIFSNFYKGDTLNVLIVGRITKRKRVHECVDYLRNFTSENVHFFVAGKAEDSDKDYSSELLNSIKSHNLTNKFSFLNHVDDIPQRMLNSHVIFLPSIHEPLSRVIIESLSLGCVIVTTDDSGNKELIRHCDNGFLYPPGNLDSLHDCFRYITENSLEIISQNAKKTYNENFSLANTLDLELNYIKESV